MVVLLSLRTLRRHQGAVGRASKAAAPWLFSQASNNLLEVAKELLHLLKGAYAVHKRIEHT